MALRRAEASDTRVHTAVIDWDGTAVPSMWPDRPYSFMPGFVDSMVRLHEAGWRLTVFSARLSPYDPWTSQRRPAHEVAAEYQYVRDIYADESRRQVLFTWHGLRQQTRKPVVDGRPNPNQCLSDFIAPKESRIADYIGLFAVTSGIGLDKRETMFHAKHDDYAAIMLKAIADRLAEAFAEMLHERVRRDLWGHAFART